MRLKLIKQIKMLYFVESIFIVSLIVLTIIFHNQLPGNTLYFIIGGLLLETIVFTYFAKNYERNHDKNIINKMVYDGKMALVQITHGEFDQFVNPSDKFHNVVWKIDGYVYTNDLEKKKITFYEQFASEQTTIPEGFCYITYDETKPDYLFIVPNMLVGSFETNKSLIEKYQQKIKNIKYLNVYYKNGLVMEHFSDSIKKGQTKETKKEIV